MQDIDTGLVPAEQAHGDEAYSDVSLAQDLRELAGEAKTLAQAEFAFQKSRAAYVGAEARAIALLLVVAAVVVFFAVMALVVGTVIALGPVLGPWGAMAGVTLALLVAAVLCALSAKARLGRIKTVIGAEQDDGTDT